MRPFTTFSGIAAAMPLANINTDAIIPAAYLRTAHADLGRGLFGGWRYDDEGRDRPDFVLNREPQRRAGILFAGENFGCGSSREAAVWSLAQFGIRCVFAPSFADIFYENAFRNGFLAGLVEPGVIDEAAAEIAAADGDPVFAVDLPAGTIGYPNGVQRPFHVAAGRRDALIRGEDEVGATLREADTIAAFHAAAIRARPWLYRGAGRSVTIDQPGGTP